MRRLSGSLLTIWSLLYAFDTKAKNATGADGRIAASLQEVLEFNDRYPRVSINNCQIEITEVFQSHCAHDWSARGYRELIDLFEVETISIRPFRDMFAIRFDFSVPGPAPFEFLFDRLTLGTEEHFREFSEEMKVRRAEANFKSGKVIHMCSGATNSQELGTSITLFVEHHPSEWYALNQLQSECRKLSVGLQPDSPLPP